MQLEFQNLWDFILILWNFETKYNDFELAKLISEIFDLRPYYIEKRLKLNPMYTETAAYGHMGRKNEIVRKIYIF